MSRWPGSLLRGGEAERPLVYWGVRNWPCGFRRQSSGRHGAVKEGHSPPLGLRRLRLLEVPALCPEGPCVTTIRGRKGRTEGQTTKEQLVGAQAILQGPVAFTDRTLQGVDAGQPLHGPGVLPGVGTRGWRPHTETSNEKYISSYGTTRLCASTSALPLWAGSAPCDALPSVLSGSGGISNFQA